jgi:hypothetical protein
VVFCAVANCSSRLDLVEGGRTVRHQMELLMVGQPFHLGLESLEPYWCLLGTLCVFCGVVNLAALVVGPTPPWNGLGRWWGRSLVPNGTIPHGWSSFHLGLESLEHIGACWRGTLCGLCAVVLLGLDLSW